MKVKVWVLAAVLLPYILSAQSNDVLDRFLGQEKADLATSVWLICLSSRSIGDDASPEDAMTYLLGSDRGGRFVNRDPDSPIEFREYAYIAMAEHKLPGGLFYTIFRGPRLAAKEMLWRRWIPGNPDPGTELTPWDVTTSLSQIITWKEERKK